MKNGVALPLQTGRPVTFEPQSFGFLWLITSALVWDASAKQPTGWLFGNQAQFGNFDECLSTTAPFPLQFCLARVNLAPTKSYPSAFSTFWKDVQVSVCSKQYSLSDAGSYLYILVISRCINTVVWDLVPTIVVLSIALFVVRKFRGTAKFKGENFPLSLLCIRPWLEENQLKSVVTVHQQWIT